MDRGEERKKKKYKNPYKKGGHNRKKATAELEIKGTPRYIKYLSEHLKKEHPSTREGMKIEYEKK